MISGNSLKVVLARLQKYRPREINCALAVRSLLPNALLTLAYCGNVSSVPLEYNLVLYPERFTYAVFNQAVEKLRKRLEE